MKPARWIVFTVLEGLLDVLLLVPVIRVVLSLHMKFQNKLWAMAVFITRCMVWIPSVAHLVYFIRYIRHGRDIIDIVPTIVTEEIWVCTALTLSSAPVLMRVTKKFTTLGVQIAESTIQQGSTSKSKENSGLFAWKGGGLQGLSSFKMTDIAAMSGSDPSGQKIVRPEKDDRLNIIQIDARVKGEGASTESVPESQIGILRQMDFDVHSESK
ncbi:hypothetical protein EPUS_08842 [Endocarpon pusillum Z07020]|uniref:Integral membrane protein n=1 Tax=Endocarpon pusillum (strain Z07020 / HMAS-L-300199) TaxID=1263415 RepID=U1GRM0_ENDPU|nr:uncharacterized protein EPUS_08842 [Endocarpon pusillum Z07020]ERF75028.1 hypothetical protein EPUS_08842 [Endocarpon pusillum Z07020]